MNYAIKNSDELYNYFGDCRHDVEDSYHGKKRLYDGILVSTKIRLSCMIDERQGKVVLNGRVRNIMFKSLQGGVYLATLEKLTKDNSEPEKDADRLQCVEDELSSIYADCSVEDWDGYGASAVSSKTLENAKLFVNNYPEFFQNRKVEVAPANDGEITIEIYNKDDSTICCRVSFNDNPLHVSLYVLPTTQAGK